MKIGDIFSTTDNVICIRPIRIEIISICVVETIHGKEKTITVDIYDADTGEYVTSKEAPEGDIRRAIRNGFLI